jgi:hypothetical protein
MVSNSLKGSDRARLVARLNSEGYTRCIVLPTGELAGIHEMLFTWGIFVGLDDIGWRSRFCYEHKQDAIAALDKWDGKGDPPGPWIKEKPSDRLGPGATT